MAPIGPSSNGARESPARDRAAVEAVLVALFVAAAIDRAAAARRVVLDLGAGIDAAVPLPDGKPVGSAVRAVGPGAGRQRQIGRASCREREEGLSLSGAW